MNKTFVNARSRPAKVILPDGSTRTVQPWGMLMVDVPQPRAPSNLLVELLTAEEVA